MKKHTVLVLTCLTAAVSGYAGEGDFHRHNLSLGVGAAVPVGSASNYLGAAPLVNFGYGYRLLKYFQADAGLQMAFGAANNRNAVLSDLGPVQGGDHEFMIPLGGRVILPLPLRRFETSIGGGGMYLHYSETVPSNGYYSTNCYSCTSRGGWGGYGLGDVSYFLDEGHSFRVGMTLQFISAGTNGEAVGNVPAVRTVDHWMNLVFGLGLSF